MAGPPLGHFQGQLQHPFLQPAQGLQFISGGTVIADVEGLRPQGRQLPGPDGYTAVPVLFQGGKPFVQRAPFPTLTGHESAGRNTVPVQQCLLFQEVGYGNARMRMGVEIVECFHLTEIHPGFLQCFQLIFRHGRSIQYQGPARISALECGHRFRSKAVVQPQAVQCFRYRFAGYHVPYSGKAQSPGSLQERSHLPVKGIRIRFRDVEGKEQPVHPQPGSHFQPPKHLIQRHAQPRIQRNPLVQCHGSTSLIRISDQ